jgi:hypothetical protein
VSSRIPLPYTFSDPTVVRIRTRTGGKESGNAEPRKGNKKTLIKDRNNWSKEGAAWGDMYTFQ